MTLSSSLPYPDELISSAIIRCSRRHLVHPRELEQAYPGSRVSRIGFLCIPRLEPTAQMLGMRPEDLLWQHTLWPYVTACISDNSYSRICHAVGEGTASPSISVLLAHGTAGVAFRRFCRECMREQIATCGTSYWLRAHNLPGALTCTRHSVYLCLTQLAVDARNRETVLSLPHEVRGKTVLYGTVWPSHTAVALESVKALNRSRGPGQLLAYREFIEIAVHRKWLTPDSQLNRLSLIELVRNTFGAQFLKTCGLQAHAVKNRTSWIDQSLSNLGASGGTTLKSMLMGLAPLLTTPSLDNQLAHRPSGPRGTGVEAADTFYARQAKVVLKRLLKQHAHDVTTATFLKEAGCFGAYRYRMEKLPRLRRVVLEFRGSEVSIKQLNKGRMLYERFPDERVG